MRFVKEYLILLLLLFCVSVITFYEVFTGIKIFVSGDSLSPISIREGINNIINLSGEYPYWLPWIFSGMPSIHSFTNISDFYYPHKLFLFLNSIGLPWIWNFLLHLIFGGCGMYSLTRYLSCSRYSSLFASICFITLPYLVAMIAFGHGSQAMTAAYIPIIILFLFKVFDKTNILNLSVFSVLLGLQLQRGHVQICYYTWMMIGLYILIKNSYFFYNELLSKTEILKKNIYVFCSLLIGFLISINIYFPVFNYVNSSIRSEGGSGGGLMYATQWSFSIKEMVTLFIPSFLGFGGKLYWGNFPFTDYPNYFGFILFVLAVIGFFKSTFSKENKFFLLSVLIFSILISFGKNFLFFYKIFYYYLPFFDKFRVPVYILILTFFILLIFASSGLDYIVKSIKSKNKFKNFIFIFSVIVLFLFVFLFIYNLFIPTSFQSIQLQNLIFIDIVNLIVIILLFLISFLLYYNKKISSRIIYFIITFLCLYDYSRINHEIINPKKHLPHSTILQTSDYIEKYKQTDEIIDYLQNDKTKFRIFDTIGPQNKWAGFNIENVQGYHPARMKLYDNLMNILRTQGYQIWPPSILQLLNVKYLILPFDTFNHPDFKLVKSGSTYYFGQDIRFNGKLIESFLYEYKNYYPRLFFTKAIVNIFDHDIIDLIINPELDFIEKSYISDLDTINFTYDEASKVNLTKWSPNSIEFSTNVNTKQFLVFSEIFYDDSWLLTDGYDEYKIYNVNGILRGFVVPPGKKNFKLYFNSSDIKISNNISLFFFILALLLIVLSIIKKYKYENIKK